MTKEGQNVEKRIRQIADEGSQKGKIVINITRRSQLKVKYGDGKKKPKILKENKTKNYFQKTRKKENRTI